MNLTGFDYFADRPNPQIGLTRTASLIRTAREEAQRDNAQVLLFDNGDFLQGNPLGEWAASQPAERHPIPRAFSALSYDAIGLGNHDFGFGLDFLQQIIRQIPCPVIGSNAHYTKGEPTWQRQAILRRELQVNGTAVPILIGVFSVLPPQTALWEAHRLQGRVEISDILTSARRVTADLKSKGCDLVIALAHSGLQSHQAEVGLENAVIPLAEIDGIDAIIAGHTHLTLPGKAHQGLPGVDAAQGRINGKPVVMQGWAGSHLGKIDLDVARNSTGSWAVEGSRSELHPITTEIGPIAEDPEMVRLLARSHSETRAFVARSVGRVPHSLHSFFTFCAPDRGLALLAEAQAAALRPYLAGTEFEALPVLSAAAPAKFGGRAGPAYYTNVPPGGVSVRHIFDLHVFPNELRAVRATGAQIRDWLEMSAGVFNRLSKEDPAKLVNPQRTGHNFDVILGLNCEIDLSVPARFDADGHLTNPACSRIRALCFEGQPVRPEQEFIVALNNYRANGGGHFPIAREASPILLPSLPIHGVLCDYVTGRLPKDPLAQAPRPFTFAPLNGACATLLTSPEARNHLDELQEYDPIVLGLDANGFLQVQLTL